MKLSKLRNLTMVVVGAIVIAVSQSATFVSAATTPAKTTAPNSATNNANSLKISPVRSEVTIEPGSTGKVTVYVTNLTSSPILLTPIENDFVAGDEKGTPSIILDANSYAPTHSLKRYMIPLKNVSVAPQATQQVDVSIVVPKTAQAGGYYGAVRFAPASPDGSKNVNISSSVASLILMTVPGDLIEKLNLTNFDIQQEGDTSKSFRTPDNLQLLLRFKNEGNVQVAPFGQINVMKGGKVLYTHNFNGDDPKDNVLADSARRWEIPLKGFGKFGKYTVTGNFTYGTKSQSIEVKKTIWIIPSTYIYAGLIAIAVLIGLIVFFVFFLKGYKKRILRGSRGGRRRR